MPEQDLRERIVKLETNFDNLKEDGIRLDKRIIELENKLFNKLEEMTAKHSEDFKKIEEYMTTQKASWKTLTVIGTIIVAISGILIKFL